MRLLRFSDLQANGIISNRTTLYRWIKREGFPTGVLLGPNSRAWPEDLVLDWLKSRPTDGGNHTLGPGARAKAWQKRREAS